MGEPRWIPTFGNDFPVTQAAIAFAEPRHRGQQRPDGTPFILHPIEVATLLRGAGSPDHLVAAGVLHDVVEKTDVTASDLEGRFGAEITALVLAVSDDDRIGGYGERKAALRRQVASAGEEALALFAADKLSKLRELCRETPAGRGDDAIRARPRARRLRHYERSLALLEERLPHSPLVQQLREELQRCLRHPPLPAEGALS